MNNISARILALGLMLYAAGPQAAEGAPVLDRDPHRNDLGFFDLHICNWPERPSFIKALFSTIRFQEIGDMAVLTPDGKTLASMDPQRYMLIQAKGKPEKRVFMVDVDVPAQVQEGWYAIRVKGKDGKEHLARDYLVLNRIGRPEGMQPADKAELTKPPAELRWNSVPGAAHYMVFLRDGFEGTLVQEARLVQEPRLVLEPGLLKPGGYYQWMVHARDVNENVILGDFNSGSISQKASFSIADP